ncbi:hypothetical protein [Albirhodobacter sp. R86504]
MIGGAYTPAASAAMNQAVGAAILARIMVEVQAQADQGRVK